MFLLLTLLISTTQGLTEVEIKQLDGIRSLLKNLHQGVYPTCNIVLFSEQVDFDTAEERCNNFDIGGGKAQGNLATVNNDEKNADLKMLLEMAYPVAEQPGNFWAATKWVWSGLRKTKNNVGEGSKDMEYHTEDWQWVDGSHPGNFYMWLPGQPDQKNLQLGKKGCNENPTCFQNQMRINHDGDWDDTFKFKKHPYACDYQGKYLLSSDKKSWEDAKTACSNAGLHLAKIRSDDEAKEMLLAMEYFLGPRDTTLRKWDPSNWMWLGGNDIKKEKKWVWVDGELIKWAIPWEKKAGNDNSKKEMKEGQDAMAISRWGTVDDSYRLGKYRPFACQCPDS